ncbi:hypothetical protein D1007_43415 [Hordeum vulgare]|nr:hypothetical protein D1007_43415 [Hordeum vulgare]
MSSFWGFLGAVLSHYQIDALHLDPYSLVLLSAFAFLCEAFVGVTPSMVLLRHFFSLKLVSEVQCFGCTSLKAANTTVPGVPYAELLPEAEGFQRQWVQVENAETEPGVGTQKPYSPPARAGLNSAGEVDACGGDDGDGGARFIRRRIAPLQRHSYPMWAYTGTSDSMRIQVVPLSPNFLRELLCRLTGGNLDEFPRNGLRLYSFKAAEVLVAEMLLFDEWGLLPQGKRRSPRVSTPEVHPLGNPSHAITPAIGVGGAPPPTTLTLDPCRAGVGGGDRSTVGGTSPTPKRRSRAAEFPSQASFAGRKRRSPRGGRPPAWWAPVSKKWMAIDE